jgi:hypothetical protein
MDAAAEAGKFASTLLLFPVTPVGGQLSRNWTVCGPYGPNRPSGAGFRTACGKLLAGFLLLCPGRYSSSPMVLSES